MSLVVHCGALEVAGKEEGRVTHDVFICHSSKDRTIANAICSKLEQNRIRCWIAPRDVIAGTDYAESIVTEPVNLCGAADLNYY
jgi:hypothetical protein